MEETKRSERTLIPEKLEFLGHRGDGGYTANRKQWAWKAKLHVMLSCCAVSLALFILAVFLIKHNLRFEVDHKLPTEIAHVSMQFCGNHSGRGCAGESCSLSRIRRIVDGVISPDGSWPWMAEIIYSNKHYCGAVLISKNVVMTAAHCLYRHEERLYEADLKIRLGSHKRLDTSRTTQTLKIADIHIHPAFEFSTLRNDIALIRLKTHVNLTKSVWPICLSGRKSIEKTANAVMIGWGKTSFKGHFSRMLREASVPVVPISKCTEANKDLFENVRVRKENHICVGYGRASPENGCKGDSGGPLMIESSSGRWLLIGVMSWGDPNCSSQRTNSYTVFTNVLLYREWIEKILTNAM